jgi:hypothetical protein
VHYQKKGLHEMEAEQIMPFVEGLKKRITHTENRFMLLKMEGTDM